MQLHKTNLRCTIALLLAICFIIPGTASAFEHGNFHKMKDGKAFFDMDSSKMNSESLPFVLGGIIVTYQELEAMEITPDFFVTFRGLNTGILTYAETSEEVQGMIATLTELGVHIQVCAKANYLSGVHPDDIVTEIEIIDNAWITSMLLQNKRRGYAYITF
jgi:intracellular sulfur oxidation DsrE/DsrF family protein